MNRNQWLLRSLAIAALSLGSLGLAACSRPTPAGGGSDSSDAVAPGPYYEDEGSTAPGDESYPPPPTAIEDLGEGYPEPAEEDAAADDEGDAAGDDSGDDSTGDDSSGGTATPTVTPTATPTIEG